MVAEPSVRIAPAPGLAPADPAESQPGPCRRTSGFNASDRASPTLPLGPAAALLLTACREAGRCPTPAVVLLEDRKDGRRAAALEADCRRLRCPACSVRRRGLWLTHFLERIGGAAEAGQPLYLARVAPGRVWQSMQRAIQRRGGEFARVRAAAGDVIVVTKAKVEVVVTTADVEGAAPVGPAVAVEALAEALEELALGVGGHKPISASKGWRLHERGGGRYLCRGVAGRGEFPTVMRRAAEAGMRPSVRHTGSGKCGGWWFPDDWSDDDRAAFFDEVAVGPVLRKRPAWDGLAAGQAV